MSRLFLIVMVFIEIEGVAVQMTLKIVPSEHGGSSLCRWPRKSHYLNV